MRPSIHFSKKQLKVSHQVRIITQDSARNRMLYTAVIERTHRSSAIVFHLKSQLVVKQSIYFSVVLSIYNVIKPFCNGNCLFSRL